MTRLCFTNTFFYNPSFLIKPEKGNFCRRLSLTKSFVRSNRHVSVITFHLKFHSTDSCVTSGKIISFLHTYISIVWNLTNNSNNKKVLMVLSWFWLKQFCHTVSLTVYLSTQAIIVTKVNSMWISERKLKQISVHSITCCKL